MKILDGKKRRIRNGRDWLLRLCSRYTSFPHPSDQYTVVQLLKRERKKNSVCLSPCFITADIPARGREVNRKKEKEHRKIAVRFTTWKYHLPPSGSSCRKTFIDLSLLVPVFLSLSLPFCSPFFIEKISPEKKILKGWSLTIKFLPISFLSCFWLSH